jgi:predicted dehydrogenase
VTRAVLVGFGRFGRVYAKRAAAAGIEIVGVVDDSYEALEDARTEGFVGFVTLRGAFDATRPSLVIVSTPPSFHAVLAVEALVRGADVLLAKPGALSRDEAERVATTAWNLHRRIVVDYTPLMSPEWENLKRLADSVASARFSRRSSGRYQDCGALWDLAPHDVALALNLDPRDGVVSVSARAWRDPSVAEPVGAFIFLEHESGRSTRIEVDWSAAVPERTVEILSKDSTLFWDQSLEATSGEDNVTRALRRATLPDVDDSDLYLEVVRILEEADTDITKAATRCAAF